jgi:signal recognition particle receptor subunit beta
LSGVDGIVFVVDSQPEKLEENFQSLIELETNMRQLDHDLGDFPLVFQWNKRDVEGAVPVATLDRYLNRRRKETFEAAAVKGDGVFPTLRAVCKSVMGRL